MTRREHYRRAQELLALADSNPGTGRPRLTDVDRGRVALAEVHATLAAADPEVAGEQPLGAEDGPGHYLLQLRLAEVPEELVEDRHTMLTVDAASFIRERVQGGGDR